MPEAWVGRDRDLEAIALFDGLPRRLMRQIAAVTEWRRFAPGEALLTVGCPLREFFLIVKGSVGVRRSEWDVAHVGPGGLVGASVLRDVRTATHAATAETEVVGLAMGFEEIQAIVLEHPEVGHRVNAVVADRTATAGI